MRTMNGLLAMTAVALAVWLGPGCGDTSDGGPSSAVTYCCTAGDPATAYFTTSGSCSTRGMRPIAQGDTANAALYETCNGKSMPATPPVAGGGGGGTAPAGIDPRARVGTAGPARLPSPSPMLQQAGLASSCLAECPPGAQSARCVWSAGPPPYAPALAQLADAVIRQQTLRIEMALLAQNFRITGSPLARGPVVIEAGRLMNNAPRPQIFQAPVPGLNATARIELSPSLEATIARPTPTSVVIRPVSAAKGASLRLMGPAGPVALDATAGGRILSVESDGQRFMMQTPGACVGMPLGTAGR